MERSSVFAVAAALVALSAAGASTLEGHAQKPRAPELMPVAAFASIKDRRERSQALFVEAGKVLQHPRCLNCHPPGETPTQGDAMRPHQPYVRSGPGSNGVAGLPCAACHSEQNVAAMGDKIRTVPGAPHWGLAPRSMAWQGLSIGQICQQLKDPKRNGDRSLAAIEEHLATDHLVGWAWHPGEGRTPAPGTQARFGELIAQWVATGAECPAG